MPALIGHRKVVSRVLPALAAAGLTVATGCISVHATGSSVSATINVLVPIKSVTVTLPSGATSLTYGSCSGGTSTASAMGFPNGECTTPTYTVSNSGNVAETIDVQGAAAVPSDGGATGASWTLCWGATCSANSMPGTDQYNHLTNGPSGQTALTTSPQRDVAINAINSSPTPGQSFSVWLIARGPSSSTDTSPSFSTTVTYTAV